INKHTGFFWMFLLIVCSLPFNAAFAMDSAGVTDLKTRLASQIDQNSKASDKVKAFVKTVLLPSINHPTFIAAVTAQNADKTSLDEIRKIDKQWIDAEDFLPIQKKKMENPCADVIRQMAKTSPVIAEAFVMDNQGANVCQNELTSDYWQGDEAKWKNSFNGGKGGIDVGVEKLDKSTNAVLQQISLPVTDTNGSVIGAITFGIKTGNL
ncbi:cache domain-containing protein, partial [bacterium]|nr:cache domain-containing protein [bacterium]